MIGFTVSQFVHNLYFPKELCSGNPGAEKLISSRRIKLVFRSTNGPPANWQYRYKAEGIEKAWERQLSVQADTIAETIPAINFPNTVSIFQSF